MAKLTADHWDITNNGAGEFEIKFTTHPAVPLTLKFTRPQLAQLVAESIMVLRKAEAKAPAF